MASTTQTGIALPADPLAEGGLREFAARKRDGSLTAERATLAYLDRIAALDGKSDVSGSQRRDHAHELLVRASTAPPAN